MLVWGQMEWEGGGVYFGGEEEKGEGQYRPHPSLIIPPIDL